MHSITAILLSISEFNAEILQNKIHFCNFIFNWCYIVQIGIKVIISHFSIFFYMRIQWIDFLTTFESNAVLILFHFIIHICIRFRIYIQVSSNEMFIFTSELNFDPISTSLLVYPTVYFSKTFTL